MSIKIIPIEQDFLTRVRHQQIDHQGQPVERFYSVEGGEPCRDVLRRSRPGEEVILASYSPFAKVGPYKEYGPVFILANPSDESVRLNILPIPDTSSSDYFSQQLVLRAYNHKETMVDSVLVSASDARDTAEKFLLNPEVAFVQARFPTAGCFACRIERA